MIIESKKAKELAGDIHTKKASRMFKVPVNKVTPEMRRLAKIANFAFLYNDGNIFKREEEDGY